MMREDQTRHFNSMHMGVSISDVLEIATFKDHFG